MSVQPITPPSEEELLAKSCLQNQLAFEELVRYWTSRLYSLAFRILRDRQQAEEVVQDAFFRIWNKSCSYDARLGRASSWMFSILHHLAIDRLRSNKSRGANLASPSGDLARLAPATPIGADPWQRLRMHEALEKLTDSQRAVIFLAYFEGLSREEMAAHLGEPVGTVKTRLRDAIIKLRGNFDDPARELQSLEQDTPLCDKKRG